MCRCGGLGWMWGWCLGIRIGVTFLLGGLLFLWRGWRGRRFLSRDGDGDGAEGVQPCGIVVSFCRNGD